MVKAAADTPEQFAGGTANVEHQQQVAEKQGKHPAEVKGALAREDRSAETGVAGPALQLLDFDIAAGVWRGSVLYLTSLGGQSPLLHLQTLVRHKLSYIVYLSGLCLLVLIWTYRSLAMCYIHGYVRQHQTAKLIASTTKADSSGHMCWSA